MSRAFACRPPHTEDRLRSRARPSKTYGGQVTMAPSVLQFPPVDVTPSTLHIQSFITDDTTCGTSDFRSAVNKICVLQGCYAAQNGSSLPTFRDNLSVPSSSMLRQIPKDRRHYIILEINYVFKISCPTQNMTTKFLTRDPED